MHCAFFASNVDALYFAWHKNYAILRDVICGENNCLTTALNRIVKLEQTSLYKNFKRSKYFAQYHDALDGNGGVATNFASAADIIRFVILKEKGGLYLDVDDMLNVKFGTIELRAAAEQVILSSVMTFEDASMDGIFITSFFGTHKDNPVIDLIQKKIY